MVGDGVEHQYQDYIGPANHCTGLAGGTVTLRVEVDPAAEQPLAC